MWTRVRPWSTFPMSKHANHNVTCTFPCITRDSRPRPLSNMFCSILTSAVCVGRSTCSVLLWKLPVGRNFNLFPVIVKIKGDVGKLLNEMGWSEPRWRLVFYTETEFWLYHWCRRGKICVISVFRRYVDEICALLGYHAALSCSSVPTFREKLSVPSSRVKKSKRKMTSSWASWPLNIGPIRYFEAWVHNYHYTLPNIPEERKYHLHRGGSLKSGKIVVHIFTMLEVV